MTKPKIIIVDDQAENLQILIEILKADYAVIATTSANKAIELAQVEPKASAILLDVFMPELDGFSLCKHLKSTPKTLDIPVFFITGTNTEEDYQSGFTAGGEDFFHKPVSAVLLRNKLAKIINKAQ